MSRLSSSWPSRCSVRLRASSKGLPTCSSTVSAMREARILFSTTSSLSSSSPPEASAPREVVVGGARFSRQARPVRSTQPLWWAW